MKNLPNYLSMFTRKLTDVTFTNSLCIEKIAIVTKKIVPIEACKSFFNDSKRTKNQTTYHCPLPESPDPPSPVSVRGEWRTEQRCPEPDGSISAPRQSEKRSGTLSGKHVPDSKNVKIYV